jgi:peptide/nickel transport system permease protein
VRFLRRVGVLIATVLAAATLGHVLIASSGDDTLSSAVSSTPGYLHDTFLRFDLGETAGKSFNQRRDPCTPLCPAYGAGPVGQMFRERVPVDLALLLGGLLIGTTVGVAGGRFCATHEGRRRTRVLHATTALQLSSPVFFQTMLVLFYFSSNVSEFIRLPFLSGEGQYVPLGENPLLFLRAMWLPWILAGLPLAAFVLRITEAHLREDLQEDFIRTARAKGLPERTVVLKHGLRSALTPIVTIFGLDLGLLLGGAVLTESTFSLPGIGKYAVDGIVNQDLPRVMGVTLIAAFFIIIANLIVDILYAVLDPRVKYS